MHPRVFREFERICRERRTRGAVLEVGASPFNRSLLCMQSLESATEKVGISLDGPHEYRDFRILRGNANNMRCFENEKFDVVLCNATLEHDKFFWKTISEIKRVTKSGGVVVIGAPGYIRLKIEVLKSIIQRVPMIRRLRRNQYIDFFFSTTVTFQVHNFPGDYYRFSPQTFREVFFDGMDDIRINSIMVPPRIIGSCIKP